MIVRRCPVCYLPEKSLILCWQIPAGLIFQLLGIQAGVFSIFDLDAPSDDLINSDFRVGIPLTLRYSHFSAQLRIYHQSSHLGDEFLLRNSPERINLSYEAVDLILSLDVAKAWRLYGGGGKLIASSPKDLRRYHAHGGVELQSPYPMFGSFYPLVAADFQSFEETGWDENYSLRCGFEIRNPRLVNRKLQILFEYFKGHSPNGQFFLRTIESYGGGIHFFF